MPTKEQWATIEGELSRPFGRVELVADGYPVIAQVQAIAPLQFGIMIFVDGVSKGEWFKGEADEARKFLQQKKRYLNSAAKRAQAQKMLRKRIGAELKDWYRGVAEKSISLWSLYWTNAKAMTRQWRKTCTDITVVKIGYGD
jgi:hypothetical protein